MKIQEYVDLIKEINKKNGVEWDVTTSTLAIYKLLKSPAVANYYNNLELRRDDNGALIICECDKSTYSWIFIWNSPYLNSF